MELRGSLLNRFVFYYNLLYKKGLSFGLAGNASLRIGEKIYMTPSGVPKEGLLKKDLVLIDLKENKINNKASSEADFHLWIYKNFKNINSIFHAHTFYANLYFLKKEKIPFDEAIKKENIIVIEKEKWKEKIKEKVNEKTRIIHIKEHGSFSLGKSTEEAFSLIEHFENLCKINFFKSKGLKIKEAQKVIRDTYFERDLKRGILKNVLWFAEEVGELLQAIRKEEKEKIEEEIGDVFAWLLTICNLLGIDLEEIFKRKYVPFCPKCEKSPCECIFEKF